MDLYGISWGVEQWQALGVALTLLMFSTGFQIFGGGRGV